MSAAGQGGEGAAFRLAGRGDLDTIVTLTEEAYRPYTEAYGSPPIPVTEDYRPWIEAGGVWLLELNGELAGLIVLEKNPDHIMIFSVAVAPAFQGKGLGIRLLEWAERKTRDAGLSRIELYTNARMERNIALYSALGYRETGSRPNPQRQGWTIVDMAKELGPERDN
jgi:ribosomal protein S18 acetylase RimI-like enzyme